MEMHYPRGDVLKFLLTSDKTSSSMQMAPLIQGITPPKRFDTITNIAEKWKQFKRGQLRYHNESNCTKEKVQGRGLWSFDKYHHKISHHRKSRNTIKQNSEDVERNGKETPRDSGLQCQNWKEIFMEFVVVSDNLTPLIGTRTAQQMELITVNEHDFVSVPPSPKNLCEDIRNISTAELNPPLPRCFLEGSGIPSWHSPPL